MIQPEHTMYRTKLEDLYVGQAVVERGCPDKLGIVYAIGPTFAVVEMWPGYWDRHGARRFVRRIFRPRDLIVLS